MLDSLALEPTASDRRAGNGGKRTYDTRRCAVLGHDAPPFQAGRDGDIHAFIHAYDEQRLASGGRPPGLQAVVTAARERGFAPRTLSGVQIRSAWLAARATDPSNAERAA